MPPDTKEASQLNLNAVDMTFSLAYIVKQFLNSFLLFRENGINTLTFRRSTFYKVLGSTCFFF